MKKIIFVLLVSVFFSCKKEESPQTKSITTNGTKIDVEIISDINADSIIVTDAEYINWISFKNQLRITAQFERNVPHLYKIAFYVNGKAYLNDKELWLNNGKPKVKLHFTGNEVVIENVIYSPIYYEYFSFLKELDKFDTTKDSVSRNKYLLEKTNQHFDNSFSNLFAANYLSYNKSKLENLKKLYAIISKQNDDVKNSAMAVHEQLLQIINVKKFDLQSFKLIDRKGDTIKPVVQGENIYILDFWFVKCRPCIADHKLIQQRLDDFKKYNIEVVGISTDPEYADWANYLAEHSYNWANYKQINISKTSPTGNLGINEYPTYVIINSQGDITPKRYNCIKDVFKDYLDK